MATTESKTYNGWTNYETWAVKLWIDNDYNRYQYWRERTKGWKNADSTSQCCSQEESAKFNLADELKRWHEDNNPLAENTTVYADLMGAALQEVNWHEIAEVLLRDND